MADWSQLPRELLDLIAKRTDTPYDLLRFRSVCTSWRSSVPPKPGRLPGRFPILPNDGISDTTWGFYLSKRSVFLLRSAGVCSESIPDGWLVKTEEDVPQRMHLLNPISRFQFHTLPENFPKVLDLLNFRVTELGQEFVLQYVNYRPRHNSFGDAGNLYMEKVACSDCGSNRFALLTIHVSGKLAMYKSGDKRWIIIQDMPSPYDDVMLFKGNFFAVDNTGRTVLVDLSSNVSLIANSVFGGDKKFLVESEGEMLLVDMYLSIDAEGDSGFDNELIQQFDCCMMERTVRFKVFKLVAEEQKWVEVKSLGDRILFLGDDCTFSASVTDLATTKGNCIVFADNFFHSTGDDGVVNSDIGVYELDNGNIGHLENYPDYAKIFWPPPRWVTSTTLDVQNQLEDLAV